MLAPAATSVSLSRSAGRAGHAWERYRRRATLLLLLAPLASITMLFLLPMLQLVAMSFQADSGGMTLHAYGEAVQPVYAHLLLFTVELAAIVTALCLLIGYPLAYLLAHAGSRLTRWLTLGLVVALWLSVLARTYGWIILLQRKGIVNDALLALGLVKEPLALVYNHLGVYVGMVHILLPYMVVTLVPTLRAIDPALLRAALSLGASPWFAFRRIYLPLSLPGAVAGSIIVFAMALGFFITPAILGGGKATTIAMAIKDQVLVLVDLPQAAASATLLLIVIVTILWAFERVMGLERLFGGRRA